MFKALIFINLILLVSIINAKVTLKVPQPKDISNKMTTQTIKRSGNHFYQLHFTQIGNFETFFIESRNNNEDPDFQGSATLYLAGDCLDECSNAIEAPTKNNHCLEKTNFIDTYYMLALEPHHSCSLYFNIHYKPHKDKEIEEEEEDDKEEKDMKKAEKKEKEENNKIDKKEKEEKKKEESSEHEEKGKKRIMHDQGITINFVQQSHIKIAGLESFADINFKIKEAPVFLEYSSFLPSNLKGLAEVFAQTSNAEHINKVYFAKNSFYQNCMSYYPNEETHCQNFEYSVAEGKRYSMPFDVSTSLVSNIFMAVYPNNELITDNTGYTTRLRVTTEIPFTPNKHIKCEKPKTLIIENDDVFCGIKEEECKSNEFFCPIKKKCLACSKDCKTCISKNKCTTCSEGKYLNSKNECKKDKHCCHDKYFDEEQEKCIKCPKHCESCTNSFFCTKCSHHHALYQDRNENQFCFPKCEEGEYYDTAEQKCEKCVEPCKSCLSRKVCLDDTENLVGNNATILSMISLLILGFFMFF